MTWRKENSIYQIHQELRRLNTETEFIPVIANIQDKHRMREILATYRPHVFNLGTGVGTTMLDLVTAIEEETDVTLNKTFEANREGDIPVSVENVEKAN